MISELKEKFNERDSKNIKLFNFFFDVHHKNDKNEEIENAMDTKRISLVLFDLSQIDNIEICFKQLQAILTREKLSVQKDKNLELIENIIKSNSKMIIINEIPNLLKMNLHSFSKFEKIQRILEFNKKL